MSGRDWAKQVEERLAKLERESAHGHLVSALSTTIEALTLIEKIAARREDRGPMGLVEIEGLAYSAIKRAKGLL